MADRLSKITTRTGDQGLTGLGDNTRVAKDDARIHAIGEVDELNSHLGLLLCEPLTPEWAERLLTIQHDLFDLGGELCMPDHQIVSESHVARLDEWIADLNGSLPPLREFILPGGSRAAAQAHVCRTVCRRGERAIVRLAGQSTVHGDALRYMNRLSDFLFIASRILNQEAGVADTFWKKGRSR